MAKPAGASTWVTTGKAPGKLYNGGGGGGGRAGRGATTERRNRCCNCGYSYIGVVEHRIAKYSSSADEVAATSSAGGVSDEELEPPAPPPLTDGNLASHTCSTYQGDGRLQRRPGKVRRGGVATGWMMDQLTSLLAGFAFQAPVCISRLLASLPGGHPVATAPEGPGPALEARLATGRRCRARRKPPSALRQRLLPATTSTLAAGPPPAAAATTGNIFFSLLRRRRRRRGHHAEPWGQALDGSRRSRVSSIIHLARRLACWLAPSSKGGWWAGDDDDTRKRMRPRSADGTSLHVPAPQPAGRCGGAGVEVCAAAFSNGWMDHGWKENIGDGHDKVRCHGGRGSRELLRDGLLVCRLPSRGSFGGMGGSLPGRTHRDSPDQGRAKTLLRNEQQHLSGGGLVLLRFAGSTAIA